MTQDDEAPRAVHDLGGLPGGAIDRAEHDVTFWDQRVDAMLCLLADPKRRLVDTAELRRGIESLGPDAYQSLSYYERWTAALEMLIVEKDVLTSEEIDGKMAQLEQPGS